MDEYRIETVTYYKALIYDDRGMLIGSYEFGRGLHCPAPDPAR